MSQIQNANFTLPEGWRWVRLGGCEIITGSTPRTDDPINWNGDILWVTPNDMGKLTGFTIDDTERKISENGLKSCSTKLLPPGSVLLTTRAPIGHLAINTKPMCTNQGFKSFILSSQIYNWFLFFALKYFVPILQSMGRGQTFTEVSKRQIEGFEIPLPPLHEQKRIATKIQELMQEVERARTACEKQLEATKALPAAYLQEVFKSEEAEKWERKRLGEVCVMITDGTHQTPYYVKEGVPFLSVKNVRESGLDFENVQHISEEEHRELIKRCHPKKGDVLYTKVGTTGIAKAIDTNQEFSIFVSVALLRPGRNEVIHEYLEKVLNSPICKEQAKALTQGVGNQNLVLKDLKQIEFPLPSLPKQKYIASELKEKMVQIEKLRTSIEEQLKAIESLPQAILRKAFRGEL